MSNPKKVRRSLVRIAGKHNKRGQAFQCAMILAMERSCNAFGKALSRHVWGPPPEVVRYQARVPRSLRKYFPGGLWLERWK